MGDSYQTITISFRLWRTTIDIIVNEIYKEIWNILQPTYMPISTKKTWKLSEIGYRKIWNFLNCVSGIDGKHIFIKGPNNGPDYFS